MKRRDFIKAMSMGTAGFLVPAVPTIAATKEVDSEDAIITRKSPNEKINLGFIGMGQQAMYLLGSFMGMEDVRVVAGCDLYDIKRDRFVNRVTEYYKGKGEKKVKVDVYVDYQDLLARKDIDAVVIATPDHAHAMVAIAAAKAGKDIYVEKPMTLTIYEGQQVIKAVRKYGVILQVGSQQRSSDEFTYAAQLIREGALGKVEKIQVYVGRNGYNGETGAPVPYTEELAKKNSRIKDDSATVCPAGLDWDKWLGPLPTSVKYHHDFDPTYDEKGRDLCWGTWRWFTVSGGGLMTDWGAHMFDIAQWAVGKDGSAPTFVAAPGYKHYDCLTYKYDNGIVMTEENFDKKQGVKFFCEDGAIIVHRGSYWTDNQKFAYELKKSDVAYEARAPHHRTFIDAVRAHVDPNVPCEIGHSSNVVCCIGNIAMELKRGLVWNPVVQKFMNDAEANSKLHYEYRPAYKNVLDV